MARARGVVTLQFGARANAVGAHYWNAQDDLHDDDDDDDDGTRALDWRVEHAERARRATTGTTRSTTTTYAPRAVMFELRGGARAATATTTGVAARDAATTTWSGTRETHERRATRKSGYVLALEREARARASEARVRTIVDGTAEEEEAEAEAEARARRGKLGGVGRALETGGTGGERTTLEDPEEITRALIEAASKLDVEAEHWSDYLKVELHARNAFELAGKWTDVDAFEGFGEGLEWMDGEDRREDVRDAVRYWAEDCDTLGGFRVLCDDSSGFGGVCARALEDIRDDYDNRTVCFFSVRPPANKERKRVDMLNAAFASTRIADMCDLYCPLAACDDYPTMPGLRRNEWFHASAVVALAVDGITTPWRLSQNANGAVSMDEMVRFMTNRAPGSHASARASVPAPNVRGAADAAALVASERSMTPSVRPSDAEDETDDEPFAEYFISRGLARGDAAIANVVLDAASSLALYRCPRRRCVVDAHIPIPLPFPKLFRPPAPISLDATFRLTTSAATARVLDATARDYLRASASAVGKAVLRAWSLDDACESAELLESLRSQARAYAGDDDDFA